MGLQTILKHFKLKKFEKTTTGRSQHDLHCPSPLKQIIKASKNVMSFQPSSQDPLMKDTLPLPRLSLSPKMMSHRAESEQTDLTMLPSVYYH